MCSNYRYKTHGVRYNHTAVRCRRCTRTHRRRRSCNMCEFVVCYHTTQPHKPHADCASLQLHQYKHTSSSHAAAAAAAGQHLLNIIACSRRVSRAQSHTYSDERAGAQALSVKLRRNGAIHPLRFACRVCRACERAQIGAAYKYTTTTAFICADFVTGFSVDIDSLRTHSVQIHDQ